MTMIPFRYFRLRRLGVAVLALGIAASGQLLARNTVINNTSKTIQKQINSRPWVNLSPGESDAADNDGDKPMTLRIRTVDSALDFLGIVTLPPDGTARVIEEKRSRMGLVPNLYCETKSPNGVVYDTSNYGVGINPRYVRFVISADCQFQHDYDSASNKNRRDNAVDVHALMMSRCRDIPSVRGALYAGDLTQFNNRFSLYTGSFGDPDNLRFLYDGLGNHDYDETSPNPQPDALEHVANHPHSTVKSKKDGGGRPHYSWDWADVHFVQLNTFCGDRHEPEAEGDIDPLLSLSFLKRDLADNVGSSGRPVIIIQHYPPGSNWWTESQQRDCWNALANYNVVLILAGHIHNDADVDTYHSWSRAEAGGTGGPDRIPYFISGASMGNEHWYPDSQAEDKYANFQRGEGAFLDISIDDCQMVVHRRDNFDHLQSQHTIPLRRENDLYVESDYAGIGGGSSVAPYNRLTYAMSALSCATNTVNVVMKPGVYKTDASSLLLNSPSRLIKQGTPSQSVLIKP